jgi:hypothetical protein
LNAACGLVLANHHTRSPARIAAAIRPRSLLKPESGDSWSLRLVSPPWPLLVSFFCISLFSRNGRLTVLSARYC